jgi:hypothetical protein
MLVNADWQENISAIGNIDIVFKQRVRYKSKKDFRFCGGELGTE